MARPPRLSDDDVSRWLASRAAWSVREGEPSEPAALIRTYRFGDFAAALGFVVRVGCAAEKHDHHPDVLLGWGRVTLTWSTHDQKGITRLDLELAEASDAIFSSAGAADS